jgi:DUF1009 family protein
MKRRGGAGGNRQPVAVIAGGGALPGAVLAALAAEGRPAVLCAPEGPGAVPAGARRFRFERLVPFLAGLRGEGVAAVVLAGAMGRPRLDPALFDAETARAVPRVLAAMQGGDDGLLRAVIGLIEDEGLAVLGVEAVAPGLVPGPGVLTRAQPGAGDRRDAERAARIVAALGAADVGQGAVVAGGLCLAVEALPGTDAMLDWVAAVAGGFRAGPGAARGLLYKAPKPGQERRADLPAIGPGTVARAVSAGLAGIAWESGGAIVLDRGAAVEAADAAGLFLWSRPAG